MESCVQQRNRRGPLNRDQEGVIVTVTNWIIALTNKR
jgi:hypothetical protein